MAYFQSDSLVAKGSLAGHSLPGNANFIGTNSVFYLPPPSGYFPGISSGVLAARSYPDANLFKATEGFTDTGHHRRYHYRMILSPNPMDLSNPPLDTPITFNVWNTFPNPDALISQTPTGSTNVTADLVAGRQLRDFEWGNQNIQISSSGSVISASILFDFTQGDATLIVSGLALLESPSIPESIRETWQWATRIMTSHNGKEQRVRLAPAARKQVEASYPVDEEEFIEFARVIRRSLKSSLSFPHFQYQTFLTQDSPADTNELYFNTAYTQLSVGDGVYVRNMATGELASTGVVKSFTATGCILKSPLISRLPKGYMICPLRDVYINQPSQSMDSVTGEYNLKGEEVGRARALTKDTASVAHTRLGGRIIIQERILSGIKEGYPYEVEDFSTDFGAQLRVSSWEAPRIERSLTFRVPVKKSTAVFDKWMAFFDEVAGSHKAFFMPSGQADLKLFSTPAEGGFSIEVAGNLYSSTYSNNPIWAQLELTQADGTRIYRSVVSVTNLGQKDEVILSTALPLSLPTNPIVKVSFLHLVRMAGDKVTVDHQNNQTYISFSIIGVPA